MPRTRVFYPNVAAYVLSQGLATGYHFSSGNTGSNLVKQLHRIQSVSHSWDTPKRNIGQMGQLSPLSRETVEPPTVSLNLGWLITDGTNENRVGFVTDNSVSCISGILNKTADEKNYFIKVAAQGVDAINDTDYTNHNTYGIGNGFITSYVAEASVGEFATATLQVEALNINYYNGSTGLFIPAIIPQSGTKIVDKLFTLPVALTGTAGMPTALRYGDITLSLPNTIGATLAGNGAANVQSCRIEIPLSRTPLLKLGSRFPVSREINFPQVASVSVTANLSDFTTGSLIDLVASCQQGKSDLTLTMGSCAPIGSTSPTSMIYTLKNATLDSYSSSLGIGDVFENVTLTFANSIGAANDVTNVVLMSGTTSG